GPAPAPAAAAEGSSDVVMPAARKMMEEHGIGAGQVSGTGKGGRVTKEDVQRTIDQGPAKPAAAAAPGQATTVQVPAFERPSGQARPQKDREERVRMTKLRRTIATRLKEAQNTAAMLTTFNEVDMTALMALRNQYKDSFEKKHGARLGFMSFFAKAVVAALQEIPAVNAEIDGEDIVYKNYYDIGVAVGTPQGLVVPVVRDVDQLSFADVEKTIAELGRKGRDGKLSIADMTGGTFTISNGGVYGSLMSTPILNPPQSGILGMHKIQQRPMVVDGKIEARPMMYLAVSYDHRIIDGSEAVTFLVKVKDAIEDPQRLLLGVWQSVEVGRGEPPPSLQYSLPIRAICCRRWWTEALDRFLLTALVPTAVPDVRHAALIAVVVCGDAVNRFPRPKARPDIHGVFECKRHLSAPLSSSA
ncbi:MAG: 2-oxoglutarate dehydrogenase complex dihydrolipoyllysine-residue succinyltransferase, partial [Rhodospirillaceae bacterium]|nr:2-oxoglutarate dehydrogenase complex dihydrolipoyllysine-residue succinyltransferase [Rhodospirillaceae bacterium]